MEFSAQNPLILEDSKSIDRDQGEPSSNKSINLFWKKIWSIGIPMKIKLFVWKAFHNGISVGSELIRRLGVSEVKSIFCNFRTESSIHLFER